MGILGILETRVAWVSQKFDGYDDGIGSELYLNLKKINDLEYMTKFEEIPITLNE